VQAWKLPRAAAIRPIAKRAWKKITSIVATTGSGAMNAYRTKGSMLLLGLLMVSIVRAEPSTEAQVEIDFLLGYIQGSKCEFYRNGTWHDPVAAQAHLREKYEYLVARNRINTAEEFIERVASQSSISGQPYEVKCNGGPVVASRTWLREELARFRAFNKRPTSILSEPR